jgi:hypothetical protein
MAGAAALALVGLIAWALHAGGGRELLGLALRPNSWRSRASPPRLG